MSIDTELIVQILKRSPQGLTPFEILDHLINEQSTIIFHKDSEEPITITKQEKVSKFKERRKGQISQSRTHCN